MINIKKIALLMVFVPSMVMAQSRLTLEQLVERLVQVNYTVQSAQQQLLQARNNITTAQFLPTLTGQIRQSQVGVGASVTNTLGAGLTANWRLFDGLGMFSTYARQKTMCSISELQKREQIEQ
ncbi:MAG: TolC family protein, partial [Mucinivorans sp.]